MDLPRTNLDQACQSQLVVIDGLDTMLDLSFVESECHIALDYLQPTLAKLAGALASEQVFDLLAGSQ